MLNYNAILMLNNIVKWHVWVEQNSIGIL